MPLATDFNVGAGIKAVRKLLRVYVDVGEITAEWELVGRGVEDSAIELNPDSETITDITGITETSVKKFEPKQTFDPNTVRGGSKLNFKLHEIIRDNTPENLSQFDVLTVYKYVDGSTAGTYEAKIDSNCTIIPNSLGGGEYIDLPIDINYSNDINLGTVAYTDDVPTFTANA